MDATAMGQIVLLVTTIAGFLFQAWMRMQDRKDAAIKRANDDKDRERERRDISDKVERARRVARQTRHVLTEKMDATQRKIDESTEINREGLEINKIAIVAANSFNEKWSGAVKAGTVPIKPDDIQSIKGTVEHTRERVEDTGSTVEDIRNMVRDIKDDVEGEGA